MTVTDKDQLKGASPPQLNSLVAKHAGPAPAPGSTPAAASSSSTSSAAPAEGSLLSYISSKGLTCLNESSAHPLNSIIGPERGAKGTSYLESDVDPELLIAIPFNEPVKLKSISLFSAISPEQAPKSIKLYINHLSLDFGDCENQKATQEMELSADDVKGGKVELRFVRFQNVRSLHILVKDNQGDEETTRIDSIDIFGTGELRDRSGGGKLTSVVGEVVDKGPLQKSEHEH